MSQRKQTNGVKTLLWTIMIGLATSFIYDGVKSKPFLSTVENIILKCWNGIITFLTLNLKLWWVMITVIVWAIISALFNSNRNRTEYHPPTSTKHNPDWEKYTSDVFGGLRYRWEWFKMDDGKYAVDNLQAYCITHNCLVHGSKCVIGNEELPTWEMDMPRIKIRIQHAVENNLWHNAKRLNL